MNVHKYLCTPYLIQLYNYTLSEKMTGGNVLEWEEKSRNVKLISFRNKGTHTQFIRISIPIMIKYWWKVKPVEAANIEDNAENQCTKLSKNYLKLTTVTIVLRNKEKQMKKKLE